MGDKRYANHPIIKNIKAIMLIYNYNIIKFERVYIWALAILSGIK